MKKIIVILSTLILMPMVVQGASTSSTSSTRSLKHELVDQLNNALKADLADLTLFTAQDLLNNALGNLELMKELVARYNNSAARGLQAYIQAITTGEAPQLDTIAHAFSEFNLELINALKNNMPSSYFTKTIVNFFNNHKDQADIIDTIEKYMQHNINLAPDNAARKFLINYKKVFRNSAKRSSKQPTPVQPTPDTGAQSDHEKLVKDFFNVLNELVTQASPSRINTMIENLQLDDINAIGDLAESIRGQGRGLQPQELHVFKEIIDKIFKNMDQDARRFVRTYIQVFIKQNKNIHASDLRTAFQQFEAQIKNRNLWEKLTPIQKLYFVNTVLFFAKAQSLLPHHEDIQEPVYNRQPDITPKPIVEEQEEEEAIPLPTVDFTVFTPKNLAQLASDLYSLREHAQFPWAHWSAIREAVIKRIPANIKQEVGRLTPKQFYRFIMLRFHPDKLAASYGTNIQAEDAAKNKTHADIIIRVVRAAYQEFKKYNPGKINIAP